MRILKRFHALCLVCILAPAVAQELPLPVMDALNRVAIPTSAVGVYVQEVGKGPLLLAMNQTTPFNPASTMKLVTSNAALELLGPAFTWKTQAFVDGQQTGDVLHGNLIVKGTGDPKLVLENFWLFMRRIRARGIREIQGDLILDRSIFKDTPYDPAYFDGDPLKPHNVGPDALLLNYKTFRFQFVPEKTNGIVQLNVDPPVAEYSFVPPVLSEGDCVDWRTKLHPRLQGNGVHFEGIFPASCGERVWYMHPYQMTHMQYFGAVFRRIWMDLGGTFAGNVREGLVPQAARLITEWESATLSEVIRDINKYSNNVMARQVLLTMAHHVLNVPAMQEHGAAVVQLWMANKGINAPELRIENGSGLSRTERISALTLGRLLVAAYQAPTMPEFMSSLPLVGHDGTMRQRLKTQSVAGYAHIKTGYLRDVRAVAGYVLAGSGKRYAVVFLINHVNADRGQEAQDALLQWVYEQG